MSDRSIHGFGGVFEGGLGSIVFSTNAGATLYDQVNFGGNSRFLTPGKHPLPDFNDATVSIRVPQGLVALVFEHADPEGGYGLAVDLLEDCPDLASLDMAGKVSYVEVFPAEQDGGLVWTRASIVNGEFVHGHWERKRAHPAPPNPVPVVWPALPRRFGYPPITGGGTPAAAASAAVKNVEVSRFDEFGDAQGLWDKAVNQQGGIIGNDYRGIEEIGSAAFERASKTLPDSVNFWYPNAVPRGPRDHRVAHFKHTLSGKVRAAVLSGVSTIESYFYEDGDACIHVQPGPEYEYLVTQGHGREYTDIMSVQWHGSLHASGQPDCDSASDIREAAEIEVEIDSTDSAKNRLVHQLANAVGREVSAYGTWIYDKGHCCHNEIHPAEQIWWSDPAPAGRIYFCNLFVDRSERFWWRHQMDDGTKLKPWGAPPVTGTFAIAFETRVNAPAKQFEVSVEEVHNDVTEHEDFLRHHLVYGGNTLIAVVQDQASMLQVSFDHVGLIEPDVVRGFVVLEATVGTCTQVRTKINAGPFQTLDFPEGTDVNSVPEQYESQLFRKEAGHLQMWVSQGLYRET